MTLEEKQQLLELAMGIGLVGEQVTLAQLRLKWLVDHEGYALSSPEAVEAAGACSVVEAQFLALEEEYHRMVKELDIDRKVLFQLLAQGL